MNWQPIETAPKDGTDILGAMWLSAFNEWQMQPIKWLGERFVVSWDYDGFNATHWLPLPPPPIK